jgi:murein DD-endopeptidase / murein LD-carboxypeptidase
MTGRLKCGNAPGTVNAETIAARAASQLGVPFRLHAALPGQALDCVGLTAYAAQLPGPFIYQLRGGFSDRISDYLCAHGFTALDSIGAVQTGDILLAQTAARQQHLMISARGGFIHAHAGLGRVVWMPRPAPWPILRAWRMEG